MGRQQLRMASVGECTIDHYRDLQQDFVGGISLNYAVHCKRSGADQVSLLSRIGSDQSRRIVKKLESETIDFSHVSIVSGATARQEILRTAGGERIFPPGGYHPGVLQNYRLDEVSLSFIQSHNVVASALFTQIEPLFRQVIDLPFEGWRIADFLDLGDYHGNISVIEQFSERLTIAFVSGDRAFIDRLLPLSRETRCLIVITLGAEGSVALHRGVVFNQTALPVLNPLDSTGCGDAFQAAFTVSYWHNRDVRHALESGAGQAAEVLQHYGGTD